MSHVADQFGVATARGKLLAQPAELNGAHKFGMQQRKGSTPMTTKFQVGDRVRWDGTVATVTRVETAGCTKVWAEWTAGYGETWVSADEVSYEPGFIDGGKTRFRIECGCHAYVAGGQVHWSDLEPCIEHAGEGWSARGDRVQVRYDAWLAEQQRASAPTEVPPADAPLRVGDRVRVTDETLANIARRGDGTYPICSTPGVVMAVDRFVDVLHDGEPGRSEDDWREYRYDDLRRIDPPAAEPQQSAPPPKQQPEAPCACGVLRSDPYHDASHAERCSPLLGLVWPTRHIDIRIAAVRSERDEAERERLFAAYGRHAPQDLDPDEGGW